MTVEERVKKILLRNLDVKEDQLVPAAALRSEMGATSVDLVEVLADLENEFNIEITDEEALQLRSYGDLVAFIEGKAK